MSKRTGHIVARITNDSGSPVVFVLEPWGEVYEMPAAATFDVVSENPPDGTAEVRVSDTRFTVFGWPGASLEVVPESGRLRTIANADAEARFLNRPTRKSAAPRRVAKARA
jgi:hypothetical protein